MKLYTFPQAPSPRRVHLLLAEKGVRVEECHIDLMKGEHFKPPLSEINPECTVPVLELTDGTSLAQVMAICRYLEELHPDPPLFGDSPQSRAMVTERNRWVEMNGFFAVADAFRNTTSGMRDHAVPGARPVAQIPELAERGHERYQWFLEDLDVWLAEHDHVGDKDFSVADITAWVAIEFAGWAIKEEMPPSLTHLADWHRRVGARPAFAGSS